MWRTGQTASVITILALLAWAPAQAAEGEVAYEAWFPGSSSIREAEVIPPAFRGRWAPSAAACADQDGVERMTIYHDGLDTYESGGRLVRVTQSGQPRSVLLRLSYEGEGELWDREEIWSLSPDGGRLEIRRAEDPPVIMQRC